jgi:hypothetical protein
MSRRSWLPLVAVLLVMACASVARAASTDIVQVADGTYWNIASHEKCDASGNQLVHVTNRAVDDNAVQYLTTGVTIGPGAQFQTNFKPVIGFTNGMLQVAWTDSLTTAAEQDSFAVEVYLQDHLSDSNDGTFFFIDTDPTTPALDGYFITSPNNPWATATALVPRPPMMFYTKLTGAAKIAVGSPGGTTAINGFYNVSIPLTNKVGAPLLGNYLGVLIVNRSGNYSAASDNGTVSYKNIAHNVSVAVVKKAN